MLLCIDFYCAMLRRERSNTIASRLSVGPSVCPSMTLRCRDHIINVSHWLEIFKKNPRLVSFGCSLSRDPNNAHLLQGEHPEILIGIGVMQGKVAFGVQKL